MPRVMRPQNGETTFRQQPRARSLLFCVFQEPRLLSAGPQEMKQTGSRPSLVTALSHLDI